MADIKLTNGTRARVYVSKTLWGPHTQLFVDGHEVENIRTINCEEIRSPMPGGETTWKIEVEYFCELYGGRGSIEHFFVDYVTTESEYDNE